MFATERISRATPPHAFGIMRTPSVADRPPVSPTAADVILTRAEVAAWLKIKPRQVERLGIPCLDLGRKTKRYLNKDVVAWLQAKRTERLPRRSTVRA